MRAPLLLAALALAACGQSDDEPRVELTADDIQRLSTPPKGTQPDLSADLEPLAADDAGRLGVPGAACRFMRGRDMLLLAAGNRGIVRHQDKLAQLTPQAPVGPSGGFFAGGPLRVSVGRTEAGAVPTEKGTSWPARLSVSNRATGRVKELGGLWSCGA